jgi:hypothetical protein
MEWNEMRGRSGPINQITTRLIELQVAMARSRYVTFTSRSRHVQVALRLSFRDCFDTLFCFASQISQELLSLVELRSSCRTIIIIIIVITIMIVTFRRTEPDDAADVT